MLVDNIMKRIIIDVKRCAECPEIDHTGAFTKGGAKWCCNHRETCLTKGWSCFKRIIPDQKLVEFPDWCPLQG